MMGVRLEDVNLDRHGGGQSVGDLISNDAFSGSPGQVLGYSFLFYYQL